MSRETDEKPVVSDSKATEPAKKEDADKKLSDDQLALLAGGVSPPIVSYKGGGGG